MKKIYIFSASLLLICLLLTSQNEMQAQQNAFSSKKKANTSGQVFSPEKLNQILEAEATPTERLSDSNSTVQYKSIPFVYPKSFDQQEYSAFHFASNNQLIYAESKAGEGVSFPSRSQENITEASYLYLNQLAEALHIQNAEKEFQVIELQEDELGFVHLKMQQYFEEIPVYGGQVILHGKNGMINRFNGNCFPTPEISAIVPEITSDRAVEIVQADVSQFAKVKELTENEKMLLKYAEPVSELIIYHNRLETDAEKLAWHITIRPNFLGRWEYFVDAI